MSVGKEYWSRRPGNRHGATPGKETKKRTHRIERAQGKSECRKASREPDYHPDEHIPPDHLTSDLSDTELYRVSYKTKSGAPVVAGVLHNRKDGVIWASAPILQRFIGKTIEDVKKWEYAHSKREQRIKCQQCNTVVVEGYEPTRMTVCARCK